METASEYVNRVVKYMDSATCGKNIPIASLTKDPKRFTEAIKFAIDCLGKPYVFSNDFKMVRRTD